MFSSCPRTTLIFGVVAVTLCLFLPSPAYATAGDLDTTFSRNGKLHFEFGAGTNGAQGVAVQSDGKIVFGGSISADGCDHTPYGRFSVARVNPNGTFDSTFAGDGKRTVNVGSDCYEGGFALALQPDGKILLAGSADGRFAVVRLNPNGTLDGNFSHDGKRVLWTGDSALEGFAFDVAVQSDGKIVLAGQGWHGDDVAVARLNPRGGFDPTFGDGRGFVTTDVVGASDRANALAIQPDGKIVVAGHGGDHGNGNDWLVIRYNPDGSLDTNFAVGGIFTLFIGDAIGSGAQGVAIQKDGKIVTGGEAPFDETGGDFVAVRLTATGTLDNEFSSDGIVSTNFGPNSGDGADAVVLQGDGKIILGGNTDATSDVDPVFALARYTTSGELDPSFGNGGLVTTRISHGDRLLDLAFRSKRIVAAGFTWGCCRMALARYVSD